ncbi:unnamed protein product [Chironomus riparius]|uniref:adenylate cyclase n=1 Tax=Chironomus riparius TaxID=315576 RepID=A0A9N9WLK4_9DIPT|nr:unnamed protein product [Chironomus riparius]
MLEKQKSFENSTRNGPERNSSSAIAPISSSLPDEVLEKLFRSYSLKQKRSGLVCFLAASIMFDLWAIIVPQGQSLESLGVTCVFLILNISLAVLLKFCGKSRFRGAIWEISPLLAWLFAITQLFLQLLLKEAVTPRDSLGWAVLLNFLVYITIPVVFQYTGILLAIGSFAVYMGIIIEAARMEEYFWEQQTANVLLILTAALIGLLCYFLGEGKQRRAFVEAKQSLEVKTLIEEQSAEQERLLLSVLPEHVAVKMRQDLGSNDSEQFKKIYMSRHENVSILYADIVGFTAISSTYCAQDLVKILNELFARFDRLAEKYQQLRIKILGDCYYCISGAPSERDDHAQLCVFMGLSMVKAIKYVQQKTNSPVDMRVGIHTGAILAGILGQRQWQYDVYSKDVELANKMESSGKAGRVHISEKTLSFLKGEFEVEPAFGEKREEALRIAGLKTYFITKVLKPFVANEHIRNGVNNIEPKDIVIEPDGPSIVSKEDDESKCTSPAEYNDEEAKIATNVKEEEAMEIYKVRLRKELVSRDGHGEIDKDTTVFLTFKDKNLEKAYSEYREPYSSVPLMASLLVQLIGILYSIFVLPRTWIHFVIVLPPSLVIALIVFISIAESFPDIVPSVATIASKKFNDCVWLRRICAIFVIVLIGFSNAADMLASSTTTTEAMSELNLISSNNLSSSLTNTSRYTNINVNRNDTNGNHTSNSHAIEFNSFKSPYDICILPSYFNHFTILILIATTIVTQLSHITKILLMVAITALYCAINVLLLEDAFKYEIYDSSNSGVPLQFILSSMLIAVTVALSILARHMDKVDRVIFKWKNEVSDQKEKASDMRRRNEALVYNILPKHVAEHFMGNRKRSHDELYSQSYSEVGVLFASMPNFTDFYSEETVNNQGLECLRFLNEVISDFDALLELPPFQNIIKIKTIGSTYMAASGLNPSQICKSDDLITKWANLALLVDFALELKKALQGINEQSFNHFVLKMGINHGPITAGVIGARKPHYDIWGNTVNVASRMESTGKAGAIQVTEETCQILQNFGYIFEQRGLVAVKGKGQLMTYYLIGKLDKPPASPTVNQIHTEVDEKENLINQNLIAPESPNPLTLSSATASPSSVRLNQNYQPNGNIDTEPENLESLESNCEESINDNKNSNNAKHSEKDPLLSDNVKAESTELNHFISDEKKALLENVT